MNLIEVWIAQRPGHCLTAKRTSSAVVEKEQGGRSKLSGCMQEAQCILLELQMR